MTARLPGPWRCLLSRYTPPKRPREAPEGSCECFLCEMEQAALAGLLWLCDDPGCLDHPDVQVLEDGPLPTILERGC